MMTVTRLAQSCNLSRTTVLYYESIGLLRPASRTAANYRRYSLREVDRLRQICLYRNAGLRLEDIRGLLDGKGGGAKLVLERRLKELDAEIENLREHQRAILRLLARAKSLTRYKMLTKEKFVSVLRSAGLTEEQMSAFHAQFERDAPNEHQEFLEFLHIPKEEIDQIREWSRTGKKS
jgi:MerR family transcriptional regulator, thiopeptide resistance regulator